jgi:hypothetical protein
MRLTSVLMAMLGMAGVVPLATAADRPAAGDAAIVTNLGFDLSFAAVLPNDRRFTGSTVGLGLSLLTVAQKVDVGFLYELGRYRGSDDGDHGSADSRFIAGQVALPVFDGAGQRVTLQASAGHIVFSGEGKTVGAFATDLGVLYDPWNVSARGIDTAFGLSLRYRYCHVGTVDAGDVEIDDAGGFLIGVHGRVEF